jgi:5'(3')-deoxyribonucleotidase
VRKFVLGVDLDGVVADFYEGIRPIAAEWQGVEVESLPRDVSYGLREWGFVGGEDYERMHRFAVMGRKLFLKLPPIPRAAAVLRRLSAKDVRIRIITNRLFLKYTHQEAVSQTVEWLETHGIPYWDICFMAEKAAVGADLYVDDSPGNIEALRGEGHHAIVFGNSTNRHVHPPRAESWDAVEKLVLGAMAEWSAGGAGGGPDAPK